MTTGNCILISQHVSSMTYDDSKSQKGPLSLYGLLPYGTMCLTDQQQILNCLQHGCQRAQYTCPFLCISTPCLTADKQTIKSFPVHTGPQGSTCFFSAKPDSGLHYETTYTGLVHSVVSLFTPQLSPTHCAFVKCKCLSEFVKWLK